MAAAGLHILLGFAVFFLVLFVVRPSWSMVTGVCSSVFVSQVVHGPVQIGSRSANSVVRSASRRAATASVSMRWGENPCGMLADAPLMHQGGSTV